MVRESARIWANVISIEPLIDLAEAVGGDSDKVYLLTNTQLIVKLLDTVDFIVVLDFLNKVKQSITKILRISPDQKY